MKLKLDVAVLYLGRPRKDGYRNVERVRLTNWSPVRPALRRAGIKSRTVGKRLLVQLADPNQMLLPYSDAG